MNINLSKENNMHKINNALQKYDSLIGYWYSNNSKFEVSNENLQVL